MNIDDVGFTEDEYEVAGILVNFYGLIAAEEARRNQPLYWGDKKNRSSVDPTPPIDGLLESSSQLHNFAQPPSPEKIASDTPQTTATGEGPGCLASPATLSPSQPHEKRPKLSKSKRSLKRNEDLLEEINELTRQKQILEKELETLRLYHEKQKTYNTELKARKQKLSGGLRRELEAHSAVGTSSNPPVETNNSDDHHRIPIVNLDRSSQMPPVIIPDLNETIWTENNDGAFDQADFLRGNCTTVVNEAAATAAAARLRRRQINTMKKSQVVSKRFRR